MYVRFFGPPSHKSSLNEALSRRTNKIDQLVDNPDARPSSYLTRDIGSSLGAHRMYNPSISLIAWSFRLHYPSRRL